MGRSKQAWLEGPGDLAEAVVEDVPVKGESVKVRGLPAAYSNKASSEALEFRQVTLPNGAIDQIGTINQEKMEIIQFAYGVVDPEFTREEAEVIAQKFGPAFNKVIAKIDELSGVDKEAIAEANQRFQVGGTGETGSDLGHANGAGDGGPDLSARAGVGAEDAGGGDV